MEHATAEAFPDLLKYGAGGLLAFFAIVALGFVWKHSKDVARELAASNASRAEDAERRFQESKTIAEKATEGLGNVSKSMATLGVGYENTNRLNENRLTALQAMATQIQIMAAQLEAISKEFERIIDKVDRVLEELRDLKRDRGRE